MAIFIYFIEEFKYLNKELTLLIKSTAVYKSFRLIFKMEENTCSDISCRVIF